jgi:hypothetical protein
MNTPTNDTRAQIVRQYQEALNALAKVVDLVDEVTTENLGSSEWFCNGYPFGQGLETVVYQFANYINTLKGN